VGYWFVFGKNLARQNSFIFIVSYIFYGWWDCRFLLLIFTSSLLGYFSGLMMNKENSEVKRKRWLVFSVGANILFLGFFKYFNFFTSSFADLLKMVDEGRIALRPAVELSYLTVDEQNDLYETIRSEDATPSLAQAIEMKRLSQKKALSIDKIFSIMTQQKPNQIEKIKIPTQKLEKYFSRGTPQAQIESIILQALDEFYARRSK
jgi:hypothetical protein